MTMDSYNKWVSCWGTATSITDRTAAIYAKNLTLRYPIRVVFNGGALRCRFSNLTGSEPVTLSYVSILSDWDNSGEKNAQTEQSTHDLFFHGQPSVVIRPGEEVESDVLECPVRAGQTIWVSIYLGEMTQMNAGTLLTGPLSGGKYAYGDFGHESELPLELSRNTNWYYFLNTVDILTEEHCRALVCFGDSITAQDWPDYLAIRLWEKGIRDVAVIRRAVSGTRILREYSCITYQAYGLKGATRFPIEMHVAGASDVILQHGINDIIHPVGVEQNPFRPWSDMPTADELIEATTVLYINHARMLGLRVWGGTLLPIEGWRTYSDMREEVRSRFNTWLRTTSLLDGCIDFDAALLDPECPTAFLSCYDSGDHLHPSAEGYRRMADAVPLAALGIAE